MNETDRSQWFNFQYTVADPRNATYTPLDFDALNRGPVIPHPVGMKMTLDQYLEAEGKLRTSDIFLELETHKLESPQYSAESVRSVNNFAALFGGEMTRSIPDATRDMGFGEMYLRIYSRRDQNGTVTVKSSTGNKYANAISLYGFTENGFKKTVNELGLPI